MNFKDYGSYCEGFCLIKEVSRKTTSKGKAYLDLVISDPSGDITAKFWDYDEGLHGAFAAGELCKVRGTVLDYNGVDQFRVERMRHVTPADGVDPADFVRSAAYPGEKMFDELHNIAEGFSDPDLKKITLFLLDENREKLLFWPAAFRLHHAMRGGLLFHTLSIVRLCEGVCRVYPSVDRDLLLAGAILHDIAKTDEFCVNDTGTASGYSTEGNLIGHLAKGAILIDRAAVKLGTPERISLLLEHMLLSHHGSPEFGAAVRPQFLEAELLSQLDNLDARVFEICEATENVAEGEFSSKQWALDNRKLYNHGLGGNDKNAKLF